MLATSAALIAGLAPAAPSEPSQSWPRPDERLELGPLTLEVYVSETAHVFHVVDQLSAWDDACHGQYREHMPLSSEDEERLERYAAVRQQRRWGQGLEETFYVPLDLDRAARAGERAGHVEERELDVIVPVLEHFAPRANALLALKEAALRDAFEAVDADELTRAAEELSALTGVRKLTVPVFPIASPAPGGGGMDGGRLRWEISALDDLHQHVLIHEIAHAYFMQRDDDFRELVERTPGLDLTLLGEGLAYAIAPGLHFEGEGDPLRSNVERDRRDDAAWEDPSYGRQRTFGLALRPLVREALANEEDLGALLPRARDVYLALRELFESPSAASGGARPPGPPRLAIAGPGRPLVRERLLGGRFEYWIQQMEHASEEYANVLPQLGGGDWIVLLVAGDDPGRVPRELEWLSPSPMADVEARLRAGERVREEATHESGLRSVLLAAPTTEGLEELIRSTELLEE